MPGCSRLEEYIIQDCDSYYDLNGRSGSPCHTLLMILSFVCTVFAWVKEYNYVKMKKKTINSPL